MTRGGWAALSAVALVGLALRVAAPGLDVPLEVEHTNAPALDAFWYLEAAHAAADGSACEPHPSYDRPLWVAVARAWFAVAGTGVASAHLLGGVASSFAVLLLGVALRPLGARVALLGAAILALSYPFVALARTPLIYSPLAAAVTLAWALATSRGGAARLAALGWLVAVALLGKGVAVVGVAGLAAAEVARAGRPRRALLLALAGLAAVLLLGSLDPTGTWTRNAARARSYLALDLREARAGAVAVALERVLLVPWQSGLARLAPALVGLAIVGALRFLGGAARLAPEARATLGFAVGAAAALFGALALLDYRPLRYFALAGPPLAALAAWGALAPGARSGALLRAVALAFALAMGAGLVHDALVRRPAGPAARTLVAASAAGLAPLLAVARARLHATWHLLPILVLALGGALDAARLSGLFRAPRSLEPAAEAARAALGRGAVLAGPYAPLLAAGSPLERRRATDLLGGPRSREGIALAASRGYTHVALDLEQEQAGRLAAGFAREEREPVLLAVLVARGQPVLLYRLADSAGYEPSPFERACLAGPEAVAALDLPVELERARARALRLLGRDEEARTLEAAIR